LDPGIRSTPFTVEEDELLEMLVQRLGEGSWSKIASYIPYRSDAVVRKRWKELHPGEKLVYYQIIHVASLFFVFCVKDKEAIVAKKRVLPSKHRR
jgi:hypothetical protein